MIFFSQSWLEFFFFLLGFRAVWTAGFPASTRPGLKWWGLDPAELTRALQKGPRQAENSPPEACRTSNSPQQNRQCEGPDTNFLQARAKGDPSGVKTGAVQHEVVHGFFYVGAPGTRSSVDEAQPEEVGV